MQITATALRLLKPTWGDPHSVDLIVEEAEVDHSNRIDLHPNSNNSSNISILLNSNMGIRHQHPMSLHPLSSRAIPLLDRNNQPGVNRLLVPDPDPDPDPLNIIVLPPPAHNLTSLVHRSSKPTTIMVLNNRTPLLMPVLRPPIDLLRSAHHFL